MSAVLPEWLVKVTPPDTYDRHTAITGHCTGDNHRKCRGIHKIADRFAHTWIISRRGCVAAPGNGSGAAVYLKTSECFGCHCACHTTNVQLDLLKGA